MGHEGIVDYAREELGQSVRLRMSTRAVRTIDKKGLMAYLKDEGLKLKDVL